MLAQIINVLILFFLFKKFVGESIQNAIEERRELLKKLKHADEAYNQKIKEAEAKSEEILAEWAATKESMINDAVAIANKKQKEIVAEAEAKAEKIIQDGEARAASLQSDLQKDFELWLKKTSLMVVKKLLASDKDIESKYLDAIIKDLKD